MKRSIVVAIAAAAALLGTGAAQAARVDFSVGFAVPPVVVVAGPGGVRERAVPPPFYPVVEAPRPHDWLPPLPVPRLPPPPWAWHHDGWRHDGWRETDHRGEWHDGWRDHGRDDWRDDGRHDGGRHDDHRDGHRDGGRDADHRGTRGPW